jgi:glycosyltransferase involved in cell wall biosynthesis
MKIWLLTNDYLPNYGFGIGKYIDNAANMYARAGHMVTIFVIDNYKESIEYAENNRKKTVRYCLNNEQLPANLNVFLKNSYQLSEVVIKMLKSGEPRPDIIEVQDCMALGYYLLIRKKCDEIVLKDIPIIVHAHGPRYEIVQNNNMLEYSWLDYQIGLYEKAAYTLADGVVAPSKYIAEKIQDYVSDFSLEVIPLPFELPKKYARQETREVSIDFLYVGRLERRKGIIEFMNEISIFWRKGINLKITLVGADTAIEEQRTTVKEFLIKTYYDYYKKGFFVIIDQIPEEFVYELMKRARCVALPSLYDNFPLAVIEAMSLGKPVLVSNSGGQAEIIENDQNGFVFDWGKKESLNKEVEKIINRSDNSLRSIGDNARARITELCNYQNNILKRIKYFKKQIKQPKLANIYPIKRTGVFIPRKCEQNNELLSLIYSVGEYEHSTINRINDILKNTTYQNFELLLVTYNSCSADIALKLREVFKNEKLIIFDSQKSNKFDALDLAACQTNAAYVTFIDKDTIVDPTYYERCLKILRQYNNIDFIYSWVEYFGQNNYKLALFNTDLPINLMPEHFTVNFAAVYKKGIFIEHGLFSNEYTPELNIFDSWLKIYQYGGNGLCLPEFLVKTNSRDKFIGISFEDVVGYEKMLEKHKVFYLENCQELLAINYANL